MVVKRHFLAWLGAVIAVIVIIGKIAGERPPDVLSEGDDTPRPPFVSSAETSTATVAPSCIGFTPPPTPTASWIIEREAWDVGVVVDNSSSLDDNAKKVIKEICELVNDVLLSIEREANNLRGNFFRYGENKLTPVSYTEACQLQDIVDVNGKEAFNILKNEIANGELKEADAVIYITDGKPGGANNIIEEADTPSYMDNLLVIALQDPSEAWQRKDIFPHHIILDYQQANKERNIDKDVIREVYDKVYEFLKEHLAFNENPSTSSSIIYPDIQLEALRHPVSEIWCQSQLPSLYLIVNGRRFTLQDTAVQISKKINESLQLEEEDRITARDLLQNWFIEINGKRCQININDSTENRQEHFLETLLHKKIWPLLLQEKSICNHFYIGWAIKGTIVTSEAIILQERNMCYQIVIDQAELEIQYQGDDFVDNVLINFRILEANCLSEVSRWGSIDWITINNANLFKDQTGGFHQTCKIDKNKLKIAVEMSQRNVLSKKCSQFLLIQRQAPEVISVALESTNRDIVFHEVLCSLKNEKKNENGQITYVLYECYGRAP